jgi:endoglucanase
MVAIVATALSLVMTLVTGPSVGPARAAAASNTVIRVNQVGYSATGTKWAYILSTTPCAGQPFDVTDGTTSVLLGNAGPERGPWNGTYPHVCRIDLSAVTASGSYHLQVGTTVSPTFRIDSATSLYSGLVAHAVRFYQAQRDGADVLRSVLQRRPSHLNDRHALVYAPPRYRGETLQGDLQPAGGFRNVEGGWFDAGDFVKFTGTTSFTVGVMLTLLRDHPSLFRNGGPALQAEARHGLTWLRRMYDDRRRVVYYQVGIGSGNAKIVADHDLWRLPQRDDAMTAHNRRYLSHRPVFRAAPPGQPVAPSLAGRLAAVFGLCAQVWPTSRLGRTCLREGAHVLALAKTTHVGAQVTASPRSYYPEAQWRDDLEWGATELARAQAHAKLTGVPAARSLFAQATYWANAYRHSPGAGGDTLNLYDVSGLALVDLVRSTRRWPALTTGTRASVLLGDLGAQLRPRSHAAGNDPFGFGAYRWDPTPHAFGLVYEALTYDQLTHSTRFAALADSQLDWALGDNAWGSSFVVGAGSTFPHCMQHVVANLVGSTDGTTPLLTGATVDGPSSYIPGPGFFGSATQCPNPAGNPFQPFDQRSWHYIDRVSSWSTVEPALDYTALSMLAFGALAAG